jgi:hypothetical protein
MGEIFYSFDECFGRIDHFAASPVPLCAGKRFACGTQTPFELGGRRDLGSLGVTSDWVFSIVPAPSCVGTINTELKSPRYLFLVPIADLFSYF